MQLIMSSLLNRPLPSSKNRRLRAKRFLIMSFIFIRIKYHGFALSLVLKQRLGVWNGLAHSTVTGWQECLVPIKFQHLLAVYFLWLTFWGKSSVIKFTNWMYLFPMNKSASCLPSRTIRIKLTTATANYFVAQNTQMIHKRNGHFVLHKNSNTSLHLIALIVQFIELISTKV